MLRRAAILVACWTVFGLLWSASSFVQRGGTDSFADRADHIVPFYWVWALLTPVVIGGTRRMLARFGSGPRAWGLLLLGAPLLSAVHGLLYQLALSLLRVKPGAFAWGAGLGDYLWRHGGGDVATYLALVGVCLYLDAERRAREREIAAATLEMRLARADLELLRWQLQPHFLFNALNTVSTLVLKGEMQRANRAIELIARYLRGALAQRPESTVTLEEELADARRYVEIEALRFGDGLRLVAQLADDTRAARIPGSILQPLVENAVRHGLGAHGAAAPIVVAAVRHGDRVHVTVTNPGGTPPDESEGGHGFGLRYVRERLRHFYGADARLDLSLSSSGSIVSLDLPAAAAT